MDSSTTKLNKISEEESPDFSPSILEMISEEERPPDSSPKKQVMIPKEERLDVLDPLSRPSVSASRPPEVKFERERREMSVSPARKTITDHSKDSEPITPSERADLSAAIARKTVNLTPLSPLSMRERRELVRSISVVVKQPETPSWFSPDIDDTESGEETEEEEAEKIQEQPLHRAPELTLGRSRFASPAAAPRDESTPSPQYNRASSVRLTRVPTKRVFPTPNLKDEEVLNPITRKERSALVRSLSIAVKSADVPLWRPDSTDVNETEDVHLRYERIKAPLLPPELEEIKKPEKPKTTKRHRKVRVHVTDLARSHAVDSLEFCSNKVKSAKYSLSTFLPMNLFTQCCRASNLYFILIASLQLIPGFSPTNWGTTMGPLVSVLLLNAAKEALDDFKRNLSDRTVNKQKVDVRNEGQFVPMHWSSVVVGDIVRVKRDHEFPADLVFLSSSDPKGLAYIETSNLDGEPSLKIRNAFYKGTKQFLVSYYIQTLQVG